MTPPPDDLPVHRLLTGPDDDRFCHRVSEMLPLGYQPHGGPSLTFDGDQVITGQALIWPG